MFEIFSNSATLIWRRSRACWVQRLNFSIYMYFIFFTLINNLYSYWLCILKIIKRLYCGFLKTTVNYLFRSFRCHKKEILKIYLTITISLRVFVIMKSIFSYVEKYVLLTYYWLYTYLLEIFFRTIFLWTLKIMRKT